MHAVTLSCLLLLVQGEAQQLEQHSLTLRVWQPLKELALKDSVELHLNKAVETSVSWPQVRLVASQWLTNHL